MLLRAQGETPSDLGPSTTHQTAVRRIGLYRKLTGTGAPPATTPALRKSGLARDKSDCPC
eukprot:COSAG06_NODE_1218_length_10215_cov_5.376928_5_plen_60_part_00